MNFPVRIFYVGYNPIVIMKTIINPYVDYNPIVIMKSLCGLESHCHDDENDHHRASCSEN